MHQVSGKQVVLKVFDKDGKRTIDIEAARNEAQYLRRMHKSHHVIDIYDKLESTASIVLVLPRMDMSLKKYIEKRKEEGAALTEEQVVSIFRHVVKGIEECHAEGIMHCDLKPENILVNIDGKTGLVCDVKIADFGLSSETGKMSSDRHFKGTLAYMSPEELTKNDHFDQKSDIWSLGVILHELLFGKRPFRASSIKSLAQKI